MTASRTVGDLLVEAGLVTTEELEQARLEAGRTGAAVCGVLLRRTDLAPRVYLEILRRRLDIEVFDPARASIEGPAEAERPRRGGRRSGEVRSTDTRLAALTAVDLHRPTPAQRVTALVNLLVDKGVISYGEYERAVRALLKPDGG